MSKDCCQSGERVMLLACSGGSNVGQIANQAAVELTREGFGKMFCLAGVGAGFKGFVQSARDAADVVVIDGCTVGCGKTIMDNAGIELKHHVVVTELGIEKIKDEQIVFSQKDVETVKESARNPKESTVDAKPKMPGCCCGRPA